MSTAKPQVMDRPKKSVYHEATQTKGIAFVRDLERVLGVARPEFNDKIESLPVPHRRVERWKYTPVAGWWNTVEEQSIFTAESAGIAECPVPGLDAYRIVFINGKFDAGASDLPIHPDVVCMPLSHAKPTEWNELSNGAPEFTEWFAAVNGKFAREGLFLRVGKGVVLDRPVLVHHHTQGSGSANVLRHDIQLESNAQVTLIHWSTASQQASGWVNALTRVILGEGARFALDKVQDEMGAVHHMAFEDIHQFRDSHAAVHTVTVRGQWVRNDLAFRIHGEGAHAELNGTFLPTDGEFIDNHTTVDHRVAHCTSSENYKGILYGKSTGVFNGKVFVRPDAQQTNAYQQNANILASEQASMNAKPELEIYADDVKCSHGCTIGQFDEEALFYARSRGVGLEAAKAMLVHAFIGEVLQGLAVPEVRMEVEHRLAEKHGWDIWSDHPNQDA